MNLKGLSLFSSAGIAETYFEKHGIHIKVASELLRERVNLYRHLYPNVNMIEGDITDEEIFNNVIKASKDAGVDFLIATPPCQGMSCAGRKDPKDPRNFLIYYAVEAIKLIKPRFVLLENVTMQQHTQIEYNGDYIFIPKFEK